MDEARIDEIIGLVSKISPETLMRLAREYPAHSMLFRPGRVLGGGIPAPILLTATRQSLQQILPWADRAIDRARGKLQTARSLELVGSCIALLGSGTVVIFAALPGTKVRTIAAASLALCGNLCVVIANYFKGSLAGGKHSLMDAYSTLLRTRPELGFLQSQVTALLESESAGTAERDVKTLVNRAQILCKEIYAASKDIPDGN